MNNSFSKQANNDYDPVLVIAVSSRTLFNLADEHEIYLNKGVLSLADISL